MKIYNSHALTKHQRFLKAIAYGVPAALVAAIAYGLISRALRIEFSLGSLTLQSIDQFQKFSTKRTFLIFSLSNL